MDSGTISYFFLENDCLRRLHPPPSFSLCDERERTFAIEPRPIRPTKPALQRQLKSAAARGNAVAALSPELLPYLSATSPLPVSDGKLLFLALLPQILDAQLGQWRDRPLAILVDDPFSGCAVLRLAQESNQLLLKGCFAPEIRDLLYTKFGCIATHEKKEPTFAPLAMSEQWTQLEYQGNPLPLSCAEAVLTCGRRPANCNRAYLKRLEKRALKMGLSPLKA